MFKTTCLDLKYQEEENPKIITLCKTLDDYLDGGIAVGLITELSGGPGSGKTQFCLQLCINVQFPKAVGGVGGKALYLDTNQNFHPARLKEIAYCMQERFEAAYKRMHSNNGRKPAFNPNSLLDNVLYSYCASCEELMATIKTLKADPDLKLLIIDSYVLPFRRNEDLEDRTLIGDEILTDLQRLALEFQIAVIITNELTTRGNDNDDEAWEIVPALGDEHAHKINQRIILTRDVASNQRVAFIDKCAVSPKVGVPFVIKQGGIRGIS